MQVSVVMPVFNTLRYLREAMTSLEDQGLPPGELEVVVIDDGSTDGSGQWLDQWAADHPAVRVVHQPNSGWPGQPRNRGLDLARGDYVFFMDSDDYLAPGALRELHDFAVAHGSDVVVPREMGIGGRRASSYPFRAGRVAEADLRDVFRAVMPHKLFRRAFLVERGLRFPEGRVRLEDVMLLTRAYLLATRVSSLGDRTYYYVRRQEAGGNISSQRLDPQGYAESIHQVLSTVRELCPDPALSDEVVLLLYQRKALKVLQADRFLEYDPVRQQAWVSAVRGLAMEFVPETLERRLAEPSRTASALARAGDVDGMSDLARAHAVAGPAVPASRLRAVFNRLGRTAPGALRAPGARLQVRLDAVAAGRPGLLLTGAVRLRGVPPTHLRLVLVLSAKGAAHPLIELPVATGKLGREGWQRWRVALAPGRLSSLSRGSYQVTLRTRHDELQAHVPVEGDLLADPRPLPLPGRRQFLPYASSRGWLRVRVTRRAVDRGTSPSNPGRWATTA